MKNLLKGMGLVSALLLASYTEASPVCSRTGALTECGVGKLDQLDVAGKASLNGTIVMGDTHIAGMLNTNNAELNSLHVAGKATMIKSHVNGTSKISGLLFSSHSKFYKKITISSDKTHFDHSQIGDLDINPGNDNQVVCLGNHTLVNGNIKFSSGHGLVIIDQSSEITGHVEGGYISQKDFDNYCKGEINDDN